jgi:hypothetical protein
VAVAMNVALVPLGSSANTLGSATSDVDGHALSLSATLSLAAKPE